jgi:hypothetical protein
MTTPGVVRGAYLSCLDPPGKICVELARFLESQLVQVLPVTAQTPDNCALVHPKSGSYPVAASAVGGGLGRFGGAIRAVM